MTLTRSEEKELEGLIETAWGEKRTVISTLLLYVADNSKLRKLLSERADDLESEDPNTAKRLRYFAKNVGGHVLKEV
jgi:hypothetical protein